LRKSSKHLLRDLVELRVREVASEAPRSIGKGKIGRREQAIVRRLEAGAASAARARAATGVHRSLSRLERPADDNGPNLVIADPGAGLWSSGAPEPYPRKSASLRFRVRADEAGTPLLVRFGDGRFTPVVPYRGLYTMVARSTGGEAFQIYGGQSRPIEPALTAVAAFARGRLGPDSLGALAAKLRQGKHGDPILGAICAYLYRAVADYDNIRRTAWYYADRGQLVPFDIALLGDMPVTHGEAGDLLLHIPPVKARLTEPGLPAYATQATPEREARIGGRCPWLGLGWDYVAVAGDCASALVDGLAEHARKVPRSGFTLLPEPTARALARRWGLVRSSG
jgi:hypothetical protein